MAKTLEELLAESTANTTTQTAQSTASTSLADTLAASQSSYDASTLNLPGISASTKQALSDLLNNGYTPSDSVNNALKELNDIMDSQPGAFSSEYSKQLADIMDRINNRQAFSYNANADASYQQLKDLYTQQGQKGMMNTLGQAATMTGGYGNSYANQAAQQTYQDFMTQLAGQIPTLRSQALSEYNAQGDALNSAYSLANDAYNRDLSNYQNQYNQWLTGAQMAQDTYNNERSFDMSNYQNQLDQWYNIANQESAQAASDRQYAYQTATNMLQMGKMPDSATLAAAGISDADAKKMYNYYKPKKSSSSSSSSKSSTSSSSSASSKSMDYGSMVNAVRAALVANTLKNGGNAVKTALNTNKNVKYNTGR